MRCPKCGIEMRVQHPHEQAEILQFLCRNPACPSCSGGKQPQVVAQRRVKA